jgi:hypothetical protein
MEQTEVTQERPEHASMHKRTEEVQQIIDRLPATFFSRATMLLAFIVITLLIMSWVIRYPDVVIGQLVINSNYASLKLIANSNGRLKLNYKSLDTVKEGAYVAYLENAANVEDVKHIDSLLARFDINSTAGALKQMLISAPMKASLGELNTMYYSFINGVQQLVAFKEDSLYSMLKHSYESQLIEQQQMLGNTESKRRLGYEHLKVVESFLSRDSSLYASKVISKSDFERMQMDYLSAQSSSHQQNNEAIATRKEMLHIESQLQELALQRIEKDKQLKLNLLSYYNQLKAGIITWEEKYVFRAPMSGKVQYLQFWTDNQIIQVGTPIFSIVPQEQNIIGQVYLPVVGSGKVEAGQEVILKLENYPFMEYGTIKGKVSSVSLITNTVRAEEGNMENYLVLVELPNKLKTNYGTDLSFKFELKGTAEIITNDRRFIERLFDNLRYFTNK